MEVQLQMPNLALNHPGLGHPKRVLLVDKSDDSRDVIRTVLERRGVEIYEAPSARTGLELLREHRPDVVVLDLEADAAEDAQVRAAYDSELASNSAEMVILGNLRQDQLPTGKHVVRKPYHYGPLIQKIEQLVQQDAPVVR